jgi:hypothetical protein
VVLDRRLLQRRLHHLRLLPLQAPLLLLHAPKGGAAAAPIDAEQAVQVAFNSLLYNASFAVWISPCRTHSNMALDHTRVYIDTGSGTAVRSQPRAHVRLTRF